MDAASCNVSVNSSEWSKDKKLDTSINIEDEVEFDEDLDDKYEPYLENVFESNEENILNDALYIYDYIN
jgi:hypothetical protein